MGGWTFLDYFFLLIILISTGFAVTKGLMRELVSLVALIGGFLLAAFHYPRVGAWFGDLTRTETIANLLGFLVIFLGVLLVGAIVAFLANRFVKMASLEWVDRTLGGIYGFLRGWLVASIIVLALIAFPVREHTVANSALAPYLLAGARAAVLLVPQELKDKFRQEYQRVMRARNGQKGAP